VWYDSSEFVVVDEVAKEVPAVTKESLDDLRLDASCSVKFDSPNSSPPPTPPLGLAKPISRLTAEDSLRVLSYTKRARVSSNANSAVKGMRSRYIPFASPAIWDVMLLLFCLRSGIVGKKKIRGETWRRLGFTRV
jgi:hypothetical protein